MSTIFGKPQGHWLLGSEGEEALSPKYSYDGPPTHGYSISRMNNIRAYGPRDLTSLAVLEVDQGSVVVGIVIGILVTLLFQGKMKK
jgi:hypothetical protein